jgi:hypothetical protein
MKKNALTVENVLKEVNEIVKTGYPYFGVPLTIRRAIRLLKKIESCQLKYEEG